MDVYGMVETLRQAEYADCTPQDFEKFLQGIDPNYFDDAKRVGDLQEEMNVRLKSLDAKSIEMGRPKLLGVVFQKPDAYGTVMLMAYKSDGVTVTMASGLAALRVRQRLVFAYLFRNYESPETVKWLGKSLETWGDSILTRNK
jgi:hypothetical protein